MQHLTLTTLLLSLSGSLTAAWNVTAYRNNDCTGQLTSLGGNQSYGCYFLPTSEPIKSFGVENLPEGWRFIGSSGPACDTWHQSGENGCFTQSQGFQSFQLIGPSN
ncbi:uncharacterized protein ACLA_033020 [Aspergillus clavatus NRRL 1]|uniref:Uncharacterized protein n=1 Tax=Aspergillus clavatus (strain ATCC 1007 / CBS 513.65 / DSM 816 / NCTC 3887 / NRRL 1 / QM 1276 / 107) TaxID=344612 RepID=A1CSE5_ASPCL|nr:uncharacterized protein ACLA_033020 [Aspergillus clavatus NRRL 1]EAW08566.1 hypothetical protein ACLA_033020 [Aspergillus clavatus NRRL 1]